MFCSMYVILEALERLMNLCFCLFAPLFHDVTMFSLDALGHDCLLQRIIPPSFSDDIKKGKNFI